MSSKTSQIIKTDYYFTYTIYCGDDHIHTEIVKVKDVKDHGENLTDFIIEDIIKTFDITLYSKYTAIIDNPMMPILKRIRKNKAEAKVTVNPLLGDDRHERYERYMELRDKTLGYFLDSSFNFPHK